MNKNTKKELLKFKRNLCNYCGSRENLTLDHKFPIILGGKHEKKNIQTLCEKCNKMKSGIPHGRLMQLIKWWLDMHGFEHHYLRRKKKI